MSRAFIYLYMAIPCVVGIVVWSTGVVVPYYGCMAILAVLALLMAIMVPAIIRVHTDKRSTPPAIRTEEAMERALLESLASFRDHLLTALANNIIVAIGAAVLTAALMVCCCVMLGYINDSTNPSHLDESDLQCIEAVARIASCFGLACLSFFALSFVIVAKRTALLFYSDLRPA